MEEINHLMVHLEEILGVKLWWLIRYKPSEVILDGENLEIIISAIEKLSKKETHIQTTVDGEII